MKRITPEEVVEAYKVTGLKPRRRKFIDKDGCGCGITALFMQRNRIGITDVLGDIDAMNKLDIEARNWAVKELSLDGMRSFYFGFDGLPDDDEFISDSELYGDGDAAWTACVEAGLVDGESA